MNELPEVNLYTRKQIERAVKQAAENLYWQYYENSGGIPEDAIISEVMEYIDVLEDLQDETVISLPAGSVL